MSTPQEWKLRQLRDVTGSEVTLVDESGAPYPRAVIDGWFSIDLHTVHNYDPYSGAHPMSAYEADRIAVFLRWKNAGQTAV